MSAQTLSSQKQRRPFHRRPALVVSALALLALTGTVAYVAFAELPAPARDAVHAIPDVPFKT